MFITRPQDSEVKRTSSNKSGPRRRTLAVLLILSLCMTGVLGDACDDAYSSNIALASGPKFMFDQDVSVQAEKYQNELNRNCEDISVCSTRSKCCTDRCKAGLSASLCYFESQCNILDGSEAYLECKMTQFCTIYDFSAKKCTDYNKICTK